MDESVEGFSIGLFIGLLILVIVLGIRCAEGEGVTYSSLTAPKHTCVTVENFNHYDFNLCAGDCITKGALELCYKPKPEKEQP